MDEEESEEAASSLQSILSMSSDKLVVDMVRFGSSETLGMALRRPVRPTLTNSSSSSPVGSSFDAVLFFDGSLAPLLDDVDAFLFADSESSPVDNDDDIT